MKGTVIHIIACLLFGGAWLIETACPRNDPKKVPQERKKVTHQTTPRKPHKEERKAQFHYSIPACIITYIMKPDKLTHLPTKALTRLPSTLSARFPFNPQQPTSYQRGVTTDPSKSPSITSSRPDQLPISHPNMRPQRRPSYTTIREN